MTDLEIAQAAQPEKIKYIAAKVGLTPEDIEYYGPYKCKVRLDAINDREKKEGKVILVTAINPTPAGEGKSTVTIGLTDAMNRLGHQTLVALREPSLGPVMGVKGGAAGGGYAQVIPMEDINLHFTGDLHAITTANNLVAALIDNHIYQGNQLNINPTRIVWHRCMDMNDRSLRNITVGLGGPLQGIPREDHFDITVASEIMAIMCLATDMEDFKNRLGKCIIAYRYDKTPVTMAELNCVGAVAMIMRDAIKPNMVQTLEGNPAFIHGGPFANIAHGCNSIIATQMARQLADYVVTEAGFGADLGAEKFMDIKARYGGFAPSCVVIVATIRALKMHGGVAKLDLGKENIDALLQGIENLNKHIENVKKFGVPYVIAVNRFVNDTDDEINTLLNWAKANCHEISLTEVWAKGGEGGEDLAQKVIRKIEQNDGAEHFHHLYDVNLTIKEKMNIIAREIYGADAVEYSPTANKQIKTFEENGWDKLPICVAKTQYSLSDNAKLLGRPHGFVVTVREFKPSIGAGFIVALMGDIMTMPGLPKVPAAGAMDVVEDKIIGLF